MEEARRRGLRSLASATDTMASQTAWQQIYPIAIFVGAIVLFLYWLAGFCHVQKIDPEELQFSTGGPSKKERKKDKKKKRKKKRRAGERKEEELPLSDGDLEAGTGAGIGAATLLSSGDEASEAGGGASPRAAAAAGIPRALAGVRSPAGEQAELAPPEEERRSQLFSAGQASLGGRLSEDALKVHNEELRNRFRAQLENGTTCRIGRAGSKLVKAVMWIEDDKIYWNPKSKLPGKSKKHTNKTDKIALANLSSDVNGDLGSRPDAHKQMKGVNINSCFELVTSSGDRTIIEMDNELAKNAFVEGFEILLKNDGAVESKQEPAFEI